MPLGANSTEANTLIVLGKFFSESFALVDPIVCMIGIDCNTHVSSMTFPLVFGIDGVGCVEGDLAFDVDVSGCPINKETIPESGETE